MNWTRKTVSRAAIAVAALVTGIVAAQAGSLKIESWRNDDADIWNSKIIPAFNKTYPDIKVEFAPSAPKEYNAALNARLDGGTAGDLITCRPFDAVARALSEAPARRPQRPEGNGQLLRRRQGRLADRRRQDDVLRPDGLRHSRLHLQQGRLRQGRGDRAQDDGRVPRRAREAEEGRRPTFRSCSARPISGRPRRWASRTSVPTTGWARPDVST